MSEQAPTKDQLRPLREVRSNLLSRAHGFRVVELSCGHCLIRQPSQKIPRRARCPECAA
jgi:hypothetical protein